MPGPDNPENGGDQTGDQTPTHRIEVVDDESRSERPDGQPSPALRDSKGWDGKLRIDRNALLQNPEALSDPEYSDDENVLPGEDLAADEGMLIRASPLRSYSEKLVTELATSDLLDDEDPETDDISLSHSRIASVPALRLERFKKVLRLCLRQNHIQHIEGLSCLGPTLQELDLYDNLISHVRGLEDLTKLTSLDLSFNKIKHIKHIDHLTELTDLFFVSNKISSIDGLDTLTNLRQLELGSNRIREIRNLDALKNLEELWLAKNKITELKGLGGLPKLRLLSIQSNRIKDLSPLREAPQLQELYISHNMLENLEGLDGNPSLTIIDISNNSVSSLKGLGGLTQLEELWASYNQLSDFADAERELADKEHLTTVYFEGNPMQLRQPALYRNKVRLALPQLQQIDATFVRSV
ncbi:protein phosphatases PP1 regulatory subunit sds22 [Xylariomycetidae sp. FL2044]|nr:protein phosphatases PP1 regulatory subunit sds22 [Xylariomycetidae sp. FL2044]